MNQASESSLCLAGATKILGELAANAADVPVLSDLAARSPKPSALRLRPDDLKDLYLNSFKNHGHAQW